MKPLDHSSPPSKNKELINFRRILIRLSSLILDNDNEVIEKLPSFTFLEQVFQLIYLRQLKKFSVKNEILVSFYQSIKEMFVITNWYCNTAQ